MPLLRFPHNSVFILWITHLSGAMLRIFEYYFKQHILMKGTAIFLFLFTFSFSIMEAKAINTNEAAYSILEDGTKDGELIVSDVLHFESSEKNPSWEITDINGVPYMEGSGNDISVGSLYSGEYILYTDESTISFSKK